jgi:sensor domain CHASE-containing protein
LKIYVAVIALYRESYLRQIVSILCFFLVASFGLYWQKENRRHLEKEHLYYLSEVAQSEATAIERRIYSVFAATHFLAFEVKQNNGGNFNFDDYAKEVINSIGGISNLQLAPNGIVSQVYPAKGSEFEVGHSLLTDKKIYTTAKLVKQTRQLSLDGPFKTRQGNIAVIGRNPVFITKNNEESFWGFASAMITLDDLLVSTKFSELDQRRYAYQLSRVHPETKKQDVFARSTSNIIEPFIIKKINLPNASWTLTISSSDNDWSAQSNFLSNIFWGLLMLLAASYVLLRPKNFKRLS